MTENDIIICGHGSGTPSTKNMKEYLSYRYSQKASNGVRKGLVAVRRCKGMTDEERQIFHDSYRILLGRNHYSQNLREYVFEAYYGIYYSDCSSSGDACYKRAGHDVGWLNTAGQYTSSKFEDVPAVIEKGHVTNPEVLQVGDALLFAGNDPDRPLQIGHVEYVYEIGSGWHWVQDGDDWYYQDGEGRNTYGWKLIKESGRDKQHWYYFSDKGRMCTGLIEYKGKLYYLQETGELEGACCCTDPDGALVVWDVGG